MAALNKGTATGKEPINIIESANSGLSGSHEAQASLKGAETRQGDARKCPSLSSNISAIPVANLRENGRNAFSCANNEGENLAGKKRPRDPKYAQGTHAENSM